MAAQEIGGKAILFQHVAEHGRNALVEVCVCVCSGWKRGGGGEGGGRKLM